MLRDDHSSVDLPAPRVDSKHQLQTPCRALSVGETAVEFPPTLIGG